MFKILIKLTVLTSLLSISFTSIWLLFPNQAQPAQAKEASRVTPLYFSAGPSAQDALALVGITISQVIEDGFNLPVQVTNAGDGSGRLFVVEQPGRIKIIKNGSTLGTSFLDIDSLVNEGGKSFGDERGLLGLAFDPNYASNGLFYVNYINNSGNTIIARYSASPPNSDVAGLVATNILTIPQPFSNHNGGQLLFGPDGYLYIGMGDGGDANDPGNRAQNINNLLGKMLRINVTGATTYTIPPGNPYAATSGADEIWDIGLRNPWRFSFDRATGDLYIGDVGQNAREEIDYQAAGTPGGINFGWRCKEGTQINTANNINNLSPCDNTTFLAGLTNPIAEYGHGLGNAVTGGFVYRGSLYPALYGYYFYADYGTGRMWSLRKISSNPDTWSTPQIEINPPGFSISAFGEDENGELYVVEYNTSNGKIRHLIDANGPSPNLSTSTKSASSTGADPGETLTYTILLKNTGAPTSQPVTLTDQIPTGLSYVPGSLVATQGSVDASLNPTLRWQGFFSPSINITVTYRVTATGAVTGLLTNQAILTGPSINPLTLTHQVFVPRPLPFYFPAIYKQ